MFWSAVRLAQPMGNLRVLGQDLNRLIRLTDGVYKVIVCTIEFTLRIL